MKEKTLYTIVLLAFSFSAFAQNCGLKNPSFEYFNSCPSGFSQYEKVDDWLNILPDSKSEPDYLNESCPNGLYGNFNYNGYSDVDGTVFNPNAQHLCGRIGMYLNKDSGDDARIKEYITQRVDLTSGVTYKIRIQVEKSNFIGSSTLQRDLTFFGYNGLIPTSEVNLCPVGIDSLTAISKNAITTANQIFTITFTPSQNYDYLVVGANCNGILYATATGYIFIDQIELTSTSNTSAFTPIISHVSNDSNYSAPASYTNSNSGFCKNCFSDFRNKMVLVGNKIPTGITATWGQKATNPETVIFTTPNDTATSLIGTTVLTPGYYTFYYTFTNGSCTMTDSIEVEVKPQLIITSGPDILNCGGNNDIGHGNALVTFYSIPISADAYKHSENRIILKQPNITGGSNKFYWSMIQKDSSQFIFMNDAGIPHTGDGLCQGSVEAVLHSSSTSISIKSLNPALWFSNPQDSIYLVLNVVDPCNTWIRDTLLYISADVNLRFDRPTYCIGDIALINQISTKDLCRTKDTVLMPAPNLTFTWTVDDTGLVPVNINVSDSLLLQITSTTNPGWHTIRLTIYDSLTNCSFYDEHKFFVKDSLKEFTAGPDITICNGNNDAGIPAEQGLRGVNMNAIPLKDTISAYSYTTWWSMIRQNGTEWVFTNPCGIPFDGNDEGDILASWYTTDPLKCGNFDPPSGSYLLDAHSPNARFHFRNPQDTVKFIWHVLDICGTDTAFYADTMTVYLNDVDLNIVEQKICISDTTVIPQLINSAYRTLDSGNNLKFRWSGPSDVQFIDSTVNDSVQIYFDSNSTRGSRIIRLTVTDTISGCSWYDETEIIIRIELDSINAGPDQILCNNNFVQQEVVMNAYPDSLVIHNNEYSSYWGVIQPSGAEYIFKNPCVPYTGTGLDEGLIYTTNATSNPYHCGNLKYFSNELAHSPKAKFYFKSYGQRKFVFHVMDFCDTSIHLTDTILVKWDFNEPVISAGPDQNPNCDGAILTGSPSASSSGTSGCFKWKQISGLDTLELIDSTKRVASLINLDSVSPGTYQFEYTLGCGFCSTTDTMTVTIDSISVPPFKMTWDTISKICVEDSMIFYGTGGSTYAWFVNDSLIQPYSSDSVFSVANSLDTIKVSLLIKDSVNECISFRQNFFHTFVGVICYADRDTIYSCGDACVSAQDLPYGNHSFISCDSLTTKIGATYTLSDTCITYNPVTSPQIWLYDTLCVVLIDTINDIYDTTDVFITNCDSSIYLSCKDDTLYLDNLGNLITIDTSNVLDSIFASTGIDSVYLSNNSFNCSNIGQNSVTVTARNSNFLKIRNCIATITILDTIKPIVYCHDTTLYLNSNGKVFFDTSAVLTSIDENCTLDSVWINKDSAICNQDTVVVKIFARDQSGNIGECSTFIYVKDTIKPIVYCHDTTLYLNAKGKVYFDTAAVLNSIDENCTLDSVWMNKDSATCINDTVYTTIYARDNSGNIGQCEATIFIIDTIKPIVYCHDTTLYLNNNGKVYFDTSAVLNSIDENCTVDSIWMDKDSADCSLNLVITTIYARDISGNIGQCVATITILDTIKPSAICKPATFYVTAGGIIVIDSSIINNGSYDNCRIASITLNKDTFECTDVGINNVTLIVTDISGNQDSCVSTVTIIDTNNYIANAGNDTSYCNVSSIFMNGNKTNGRIIGTWKIDSSFSNPNYPTIDSLHKNTTRISNLIEGEYRFIWNISNKICLNKNDTVLINIFDQPFALLPPDIDLCSENSVSIIAQPITGTALGFWSNYSNNLNIPTNIYYDDSAKISNLQGGGKYYFYFEVSNGVCPVSRDSIIIAKHFIPKLNFELDTTDICEENCINFTNTSSIAAPETIVSYLWKVGSFTTTTKDFSLCFDEAGKKSVSLIATSNFGCKDTISRINYITVHPNPVAGFTHKPNNNLGSQIQFTDKSIASLYFNYNFGDGDSSNLQDPSHNYVNNGRYTVRQIVSTDFGCKDTAIDFIDINPLSFYVPNAFTPNNDGTNDIFLPIIYGVDSSRYEFLIFNRWGEAIFNTTETNKGWDGKHKGIDAQNDSYVWKIIVTKNGTYEVKEYFGHITLIR